MCAACEAAPHPQEAEIAVHGPLVLIDAGAEQRASAPLGTPLAAGVVADRGSGPRG